MTSYLATTPGVYFCKLQGRTIFLSLHDNRYLALSPALEIPFAAFCSGHCSSDDLIRLAPLVRKGLLEWVETPRPYTPTFLDDAVNRVPQGNTAEVGDCLRAVLSRLHVRLTIRWRGLQTALALTPAAVDAAGDNRMASRAADAFAVARRILGSRDQCLEEAIALRQFLASSGTQCALVIGVRLSPFQAHSWVQYGRALLLDDPDEIRAFTPIAVFE